MKKEAVIDAVLYLLLELGIPVTRGGIYDEFLKHPGHPSLLSISDVLNRWSIPNGAYRIKPAQLVDIPRPFLAHFQDDGGSFVAVNQIDDDFITIRTEHGKLKKLPRALFIRSWSGTVLALEAGPDSGDPGFSKKRQARLSEMAGRFSGVILIFIFFAILLWQRQRGFPGEFNINLIFLLLCKTAGIAVCMLLLAQSFGQSIPFAERLCSSGKSTNCDDVLKSRGAAAVFGISWSEIGFVYFGGSCIALIVSDEPARIAGISGVLNLLCLPYTLYALYYQARIVHKWCVLCCIVHLLLWLEALAFYPYVSNVLHIPVIKSLIILMAGLFLAVGIWLFLRAYMNRSNTFTAVESHLKKIKYDTVVFQSLLHAQPRCAALDESFVLAVGNSEADHVITMVSNPYCQPCAGAHKVMEGWLKIKDIRLQVIFSAAGRTVPESIVAHHLMTLYKAGDEELLLKAMHTWYQGDVLSEERWLALYPGAGYDTGKELQYQANWCKETGIEFTPTIFIDGFRLPPQYSLEDIHYLI
ncbi:vitamin K epoxide reductase family protein [Mucilaginibacter sp.]|uniref:vitamin K epoxide reductase family protein n=1 Tax=Mucilaginibacter sp. TaxID=1882438 RepID=UPI0025D5FE39|nr:vitamin K epoxide reductase family protein [Mucilaginibacter sp.]